MLSSASALFLSSIFDFRAAVCFGIVLCSLLFHVTFTLGLYFCTADMHGFSFRFLAVDLTSSPKLLRSFSSGK